MTSRHAGLRRCICRAGEQCTALLLCSGATTRGKARSQTARRPPVPAATCSRPAPRRPPPPPPCLAQLSARCCVSRSGREDQARSGPFAQGGGRPSVSGICPSSRAWCRAGCRCPLASCGNTHQRSEDQIDQQHFSFRLRLCGRRAWLARQWMLPRAAPESGTRGCISALPCLASPVSQYACSASLLRLGPQPRSARSAAGRLAGEGRVLAPK